jgi:hypothetical protein
VGKEALGRGLLICDLPEPDLLLEVEPFLGDHWPGMRRLTPNVFVGNDAERGNLHQALRVGLAGRLSHPLPAGSKIYYLSTAVVYSDEAPGPAHKAAALYGELWLEA